MKYLTKQSTGSNTNKQQGKQHKYTVTAVEAVMTLAIFRMQQNLVW